MTAPVSSAIEQSLKHAVADRVGVLRRDAARQRRGDAVGEMPGAELLGAMRLGRKAEAEFERALAGQAHDQHAVGGAVVERHRAAQQRAAVGEVAHAVDQRQRLVAVGVQLDLGIGHRRQRLPGHADLELHRGLGRVEAEIGERGVAHVVGGKAEQDEGGERGEAMPDDVAPGPVAHAEIHRHRQRDCERRRDA
ncbi:hypothetical protein E4K65_05250 [Bradyrhizobium niftali]|uniref:Uncharacterized protein n=1 Tax=Bradyrhizobium niftali TaxID=2560055 RepID=A0A4Y9M340_9BRAD|nr:hypothetical protein E4K65_05250 [Bradyrhizobium niftali]